MAYLAIARKYRPATFDEIVGQDHVTRTLRNAITRGRVHHAFLFAGPRGVGKTTAARALAKALNCERGPTPDPCGVCRSCMEITAGTSPDLIEIDGASNNSVDDVRELRETVRYAPQAGKWKIYLIDEVHMLSGAAFNALLKTLEEPPPHVVFLFATTEAGKLPDTILSRVQRFDFKRIPVPIVVARLAEIAASESLSISEPALAMIARAGEGSMRDAQSLLDKVISVAGADAPDALVAETLGLIDRTLLFRMLEGLVQGDPAGCLDVIAEVYDHGHEMVVFSEELLEILRHAAFVRLSEGVRRHVDLPAEEVERLVQVTAATDAEALARTFQAMVEIHDQVARASRPRFVLEMAVARLATVRPIVPLAGLVQRLEVMERRLRGSEPPARANPPQRPGPPGRAASRGVPERGQRPRVAVHLAPDAPDRDRWQAFRGVAGAEAAPLLEGAPQRRGEAVVVWVEAGRTLAAARRVADDADVQDAFHAAYGPNARLVVEATLASRRPGLSSELELEVRGDAVLRAVEHVLGGVLDDLVDLRRPS